MSCIQPYREESRFESVISLNSALPQQRGDQLRHQNMPLRTRLGGQHDTTLCLSSYYPWF